MKYENYTPPNCEEFGEIIYDMYVCSRFAKNLDIFVNGFVIQINYEKYTNLGDNSSIFVEFITGHPAKPDTSIRVIGPCAKQVVESFKKRFFKNET